MKVVQMTPATFVEAVVSGDLARRNSAFRTLYTNRMVVATIADWCRFYNFTKAEPDDILQEGILALDRLIREGRFRGESKVETFLLAVCRNLIRDGIKKVSNVVFKSEINDATAAEPQLVADQISLAEQSEAENERDSILNRTLEGMGENCRDSLKLYYYENQSMKQVADAREWENVQTAKNTIARCREKLRSLLLENPNLTTLLSQLK